MTDPLVIEATKVVAVSVLGYAWQWCRAPERIHNGWSWAGFALLSLGAYVWIEPAWRADLRVSILGAYMLFQSARGSAASAKDVHAAPKTNSISSPSP